MARERERAGGRGREIETEREREREIERERERERSRERERETDVRWLPGCLDVVFIFDVTKKAGRGYAWGFGQKHHSEVSLLRDPMSSTSRCGLGILRIHFVPRSHRETRTKKILRLLGHG